MSDNIIRYCDWTNVRAIEYWAVPFDLKCLVLDDDHDWIDLIGRALTLSRLDVNLVPFLEAEAALAYLRHNQVDLILSDIRMPGMGGIGFVSEFRRFNRTTPVILISSDVMSPDEAITHGANAFVRKGALNTQLRPAIERIAPPRSASVAAPR